MTACWLLLVVVAADPRVERVDAVRKTAGLAAFWDFVKRAPDGRFDAYQAKGASADLRLDAGNYVFDYWGEGRRATYEDLPMLGRGPFGDAVRFAKREGNDFRPLLYVPRERVHDSRIDVKGAGRSVSMVLWLAREAGNHAIAGIWHEGTDLKGEAGKVTKVERGRRQYALFMGLAANHGGSAAHVSENGGASFGDKYARNLSVTPEKIPAFVGERDVDSNWSVVAFAFDNARNTVTSYLNGVASEHWIEQPERHPFFQWPARGWLQAQLSRMPGLQEGEDPQFARDQFYEPSEGRPRKVRKLGANVELHEFDFTRVRVTLGDGGKVIRRELVALRANPFWFPNDLYAPKSAAEGGPFTIGEVIHTSRSQGFIGYLGGVAVFDRALSAKEMRRLAAIGRTPVTAPR